MFSKSVRFIFKSKLFNFDKKYVKYYSNKVKYVLGIESSCDETGAAIVDENGNVLGEGLSSQMQIHLDNGGVIPHIAYYYHKKHIHEVVDNAVKQSGLDLQDISAFAATVKPGLRSSLEVGLEFGRTLAKKFSKPFIPIHHMEAHSLTIRMVESVSFPFLTLLVSGGHCQLALVKDVNTFLLLGTSWHNSPGEVLDKIARRLKLQNIPACYNMSGGQAIEYMAQDGDPLGYDVPYSMVLYRDCNFSFAGYGSYAHNTIAAEEVKYDVPADGVIPGVKDFCASLLYGYAIHLMHRTQRAILFCDEKGLFEPGKRTLVLSGGVACNKYIKNALLECCESMDCRFACPPPKLCTDNGIMIAWNGMEKLKEGFTYCDNLDSINVEPDAPLGIDITDEVKKASIKVRVPKLQSVTLLKLKSN